VTPIASVEGRDNFKAYCAVCHGTDAKGNGPAAPAMKVPVPDLTLIAKRHDGKFDPIAIERTIRGTDKSMSTPAHGVEDMPIWGDVFRSAGSLTPSTTTIRVRNLVTYLQGLQQ
jgi:mono/diheme cytochrome c family protein